MPKALPVDAVRVVNLRSLVLWGGLAYAAYLLIDAVALALLVFGVAFFLAILLEPPIRRLHKRGMSRRGAVGVVVATLLATLAVLIWWIVPPIVEEAVTIGAHVPSVAASLQQRLEDVTTRYPEVRKQIASADLAGRLGTIGQALLPRVGRLSLSFLSGIISILFVLVVALYTIADPTPLVRGPLRALPASWRWCALRVLARMSGQFQAWARATFLMMLCIGVLTGIALWLIGARSPLLFALIAGLGEAIPTIGPILSAVPPILVTLSEDPAKALWIAVIFLGIQQVENNLLVPRIMASTMNLHPVSVLFFVVSLGSLIGPLGILLAAPLCATVKVLFEEVYLRRRARDDRATSSGTPTT